ncbi:MAG: TonB-dependent receptor [Gammaproteobacteria bacterium]|nr:TonB-dependent receptor [Gammaproteobacteria bacterium]
MRTGIAHARTLLRALPAGALLLAAAVAAATSQPALDEIVITATRVERQAFDVPAAVDAVRLAERPEALGANASEYLGAVAGLLVRDRQNYALDQQISVRGFGARAQFGIVGIKLYVDGIPATMPDGQGQTSHFNFDSAERFEILRGPFSVLYGNSSGGVVQLFTAEGSGRPQWRANMVGGAFDTWRTSLNARGAAGGVGFNVDFTRLRTDGPRGHSAARRDSGNLRLDFHPWDGNHAMLVANRLSSPYALDAGTLNRAQFAADPTLVAPTALQFDTQKSLGQTQVGLVDEQRIGATQTLHLAAYGGRRRVVQFLATSIPAQSSPLSAGGVVDLHNRYGGADARWTLAAALAGRPFTLVAGAAWDAMSSRRRGYNNFSGTATGVIGNLRRDEDNRLHDFDQYLQANWDFAARWSTLMGVRHSDVHFDSEDHYVTATNPDDSGSTRFEAWTPAASLLFKARPDLNVYASFGRGFDTPTFDNLAYRSDGVSGLNLALQPAHTANVEIGLKWRRGRAAYTRIGLFRSVTRDEIAVESSAGGRSTYHNVGRTRRQGAEFELDASHADAWRWQASYTLLDARYRDSFQTCTSSVCPVGSGPIVPAGQRIPGVPRSTAYASLRYDRDHGWNVALEASYLAPVPVNDFNTEYAPAYALLGASGGYLWRRPGWMLRVFGRIDNLLDRRYVSAVTVNDNFGRYYIPGAGRNAYLGFTFATAAP